MHKGGNAPTTAIQFKLGSIWLRHQESILIQQGFCNLWFSWWLCKSFRDCREYFHLWSPDLSQTLFWWHDSVPQDRKTPQTELMHFVIVSLKSDSALYQSTFSSQDFGPVPCFCFPRGMSWGWKEIPQQPLSLANQNERGIFFHCRPLDLTALVRQIHYGGISLSPAPSKALRILLSLGRPQREIACWHAQNLCSLKEQAPKSTLQRWGKRNSFPQRTNTLKKMPWFLQG